MQETWSIDYEVFVDVNSRCHKLSLKITDEYSDKLMPLLFWLPIERGFIHHRGLFTQAKNMVFPVTLAVEPGKVHCRIGSLESW